MLSYQSSCYGALSNIVILVCTIVGLHVFSHHLPLQVMTGQLAILRCYTDALCRICFGINELTSFLFWNFYRSFSEYLHFICTYEITLSTHVCSGYK